MCRAEHVRSVTVVFDLEERDGQKIKREKARLATHISKVVLLPRKPPRCRQTETTNTVAAAKYKSAYQRR